MVPNGQWKFRRSAPSRTMSNESELETAIERQRRLLESRFRSDYDWLRLVFLGAILIAISAVALADALAVQHLSGHFSGSSAIFGGMAITLFVTKIARGALYLDWLLNAVFYFLAGLALSWDEDLTRTLSLFYVCSLMFACAAARIWIGLTASPEEGASWLLCSGCVTVFGGFWIAFAWPFAMPMTIALIFAFDTLFQGIAIAGFGISLKEDR